MNEEEITKEMAYLCIGEDLNKLNEHQIYLIDFHGIKYYEVDNCKLIRNEKRIYCSCNESYCWHVFKVIFDSKKAQSRQLDIISCSQTF